MTLIDASASQAAGFGATSQRLFSSVAHAMLHGLSRFLMPASPGPGGSEAGSQPGQMNATAQSLDLELHLSGIVMACPACVAAVLAS